MKSLKMITLSVMIIISILGTLGTNAQLLTTTEKIPLGEFQKNIKCLRRLMSNEFVRSALPTHANVTKIIPINFR